MADNLQTAENNKSANSKLTVFLPELLPILALATAALAFVFTFFVGVSNSAGQSKFFYSYFKDFNAFEGLEEVLRDAVHTVSVAGLLIGIFGLLAVTVCAGLTCFNAVRKYALKHEADVEKFSLCTYFAYIAFSAVNYALNNAVASIDGVKVSAIYNGATIAGLVITTLVAGAYVGLKTYINRGYCADKFRLADVVFKAVRIVVLAVLAGLVTAPILNIKLESGARLDTNFIPLISQSLFTSKTNKIDAIASSSAGGLLVVSVIVIYSVALIALNLFSLFSKRKDDKVFYIIGAVITLVLMFFAAVASSNFTDIAENSKFSIGVPIAVTVISAVLAVSVIVYPAVTAFVAKKADEKNSATNSDGAFLEVKDLSRYFVVGKDFFGRPTKYLKAVDGVTFKLQKGQTLGIVGESGCGKTTMGRTILRLYDVTKGEVWFKGKKISSLGNRDFDKLRPDMQMIFQDPYASLSPRLTVGEIIGEAVKQHKLVSKKEYHDYVLSVMKMCGLQPHYFERYPHEFSGGQRQRICIARALALKPELVVCDEPVSALDVSIQAQIINMLIDLRKTLGLTYIFISHDLSVVKHISDMVGVMYLGSMVEYGSRDNIFENTLHPYTKALFSAVPVPDPHVKMNRIILKGDIPSPVNPPSGCKFHTRCESCMEICGRISPRFKEVEKGHFCACHLYNTIEDTIKLENEYAEQLRLAELEEAERKHGFAEKVKDKLKSIIKKDKTQDGKDDVPKE